MARLLYTLTIMLLLPWALLHLLWRSHKQPEYLRHWGERFGYYRRSGFSPTSQAKARPTIWIHAVSVGETRAAQPLVAELAVRYPQHLILFTHMTPTGRATSEEVFGINVSRVYLPYDTPWAVARFLKHFRPAIGLIMETEIWPNLVAACRLQNIPLLLVNARLSERSARRYAALPSLTRGALAQLAAVAAQGEEDAKRLMELGARDVVVTGNMKFDITPPGEQLSLGGGLRAQWTQLGMRPVLLAASTRAGEEALILAALAAQPVRDLLLVIVPRHPQRFAEVAALAATQGFKVQRRSSIEPVLPETTVLIGDSMGEMFAYYAACDVAFIGGSLQDFGSQNLIEACAVGVPLLIGPSTFNFTAAARQAIACGAAQQVADATELVSAAAALLKDIEARTAMGAAGRAFAARHRGATSRTLDLVAPFVGLPP